MKKFKNTALITHTDLLENHFDQLFQCAIGVSSSFEGLLFYLKPKMTSFYSAGNCFLLDFDEISKQIYFVNKGMVVAFYKDNVGAKAAYALFVEGEMVIFSDDLNNELSVFSFMACPNTNLIGFSKEDLDLAQAAFPKAEKLVDKMIGHQSYKKLERDSLLRGFGEERVVWFLKKFFMVFPFDRKNWIDRDVMASFLSLNIVTLNRLLAKLRREALQEAIKTGIPADKKWTK